MAVQIDHVLLVIEVNKALGSFIIPLPLSHALSSPIPGTGGNTHDYLIILVLFHDTL